MSGKEDGWMKYAVAVAGDLERDRARVRQVKAGEELGEKIRYGEEWNFPLLSIPYFLREMRGRESGRRAERSTNLRERISSGRVIKSESQQTYPRLYPPFSPLNALLFTVISCLVVPELPSHFPVSLSFSRISLSVFLFSACSPSPVPGQLPSFFFY